MYIVQLKIRRSKLIIRMQDVQLVSWWNFTQNTLVKELITATIFPLDSIKTQNSYLVLATTDYWHVWVSEKGQCCECEAQCGQQTKTNWSKTTHCTCKHLGLVPINTHTHTHTRTHARKHAHNILLCGYDRLSSGPTEGLILKWPIN